MTRIVTFTKAALVALPLPASGQQVTYHNKKTAGLTLNCMKGAE